ncbi:hypothetical protein SAMN04488239_105161 [Ruegeria marina]|uniref:Uncharacterized protein n=1 Tax=Ruegeria marina TaxID=639004 RepID=A0A1G6S371_9RHOB|nr:hypothetical protein SAMN04488239_105161 [Ruegeria marina]
MPKKRGFSDLPYAFLANIPFFVFVTCASYVHLECCRDESQASKRRYTAQAILNTSSLKFIEGPAAHSRLLRSYEYGERVVCAVITRLLKHLPPFRGAGSDLADRCIRRVDHRSGNNLARLHSLADQTNCVCHHLKCKPILRDQPAHRSRCFEPNVLRVVCQLVWRFANWIAADIGFRACTKTLRVFRSSARQSSFG